jgi:hypothetical protein
MDTEGVMHIPSDDAAGHRDNGQPLAGDVSNGVGVAENKWGDVFGRGAGLFFIGYFIFEVPSNLILHRVGARMWIARIMIVWGLISTASPPKVYSIL